MGSSAITPIIKGQTGPTGPKGPKGTIGPTGTGVGLTGNTGTTGRHVTNVFPGTFFIISEGPGIQIAGTRGPTGYTGTMFGENLGTGLTLYSAINGFTLSVRGLTFVGNLSAEVTGGTILITPADVYYGVTLATGIQNDRVLYSKTSSIIDSTRIQLGKTHSDFIFSRIQGITPGSLPVYSEMSGNVIDVPAGGNDIILGLTQGSIYRIHTPLGLSGFTLTPSLYGDNEILSFTFFIEGNGFTQFPPNVYFEDSPYSSVFGCGTNIMNLMTHDKGQNWFATISDRGYGVNACLTQDSVGSCCYVGPSGERECVEYVTEDWCNGKTGTFNSMTACDPLCRETAICCSSGQCIQGVNQEECEYFLGKYYRGISCSENICSPTVSSCCTGGTCIDGLSALLCLEYYGGTFIPGSSCAETSCETSSRIEGACCKFVGGAFESCAVETPSACLAETGIFYGNGTTCGGVNCDCFSSDPEGSCCFEGNCLSASQSDCTDSLGGTWYSTQKQCETNCITALGSCCQFGICTSGISESECFLGTWFADASSCANNCGSCCQPVDFSIPFCNFSASRSRCETIFQGTWYPNTNCSGACP